MSLFDVDSTAEAIQEDEELIEAVENLMETAAVSLKSEIVSTIEEIRQSVVSWLEWLFPFWIAYQQDERLFWEDLQKLILYSILLAVSCVLLAPSSAKRRGRSKFGNRRSMLHTMSRHSFRLFRSPHYARRHSSYGETIQVQAAAPLQHLPSTTIRPMTAQQRLQMGAFRPAASICSGRVILEEEETDQERFEKIYPSMARSSYSRLVLPPACKLVEKPRRPSTKINNKGATKKDDKKRRKKRSGRKNGERDYEDHPLKRLQLYGQNLILLIKSLLSYDFVGAGWWIIHWLESCLKIRQYRRTNNHPDDPPEDEDDDDDESKASASASISVASTTTGATSRNNFLPTSLHSVPHTPDRNDHSQQLYLDSSFQSASMLEGEEKKESPLVASMNGSTAQTPPPMSFDSIPPAMQHGSNGKYTTVTMSNVTRRGSESSTCSTPSQASADALSIGETNEGHTASLRLPLSGTMSAKSQVGILRSSIGGKKKDLLENYRSTSSLLGAANRTIHPQSTSSTSQSTFSSMSTTNINTKFNMILNSQLTSGESTTVHSNHHRDDVSQEYDNAQEDDNFIEEESLGDPSDTDDGTASGSRRHRTDSDFSGYFFETANTHESIHQMSREAAFPDKNGYIVGDEFLPDSSNCTPLLVFVNSRSGPQQGHLLITQLRRLLNPIQVWDLGEDGGPEIILESFTVFRNLRIMVCGGDGTVSWIIATLEKLKLKRKWPPIAILPLGTGNDLARIHGWGGGYNNESLIGILEQVADSYISLLDRWEMTIENRKGKVKEIKSFFNYLGVGADAQAALQVHMLRESRPQLFFSRVVNKAWYGLFGAEDIIKATSLNLPNEITLIADGVEVPLPPDSQGIILLNIDSYAGGATMWANGTKPTNGLMQGYEHSSSDGSGALGGSGGIGPYQPRALRRTRSLEDLGARRHDHGYRPMERIDSIEDLNQLLTDDQRYERVTACDEPSSCQDGILDVVSIRGAFHLGQIRVGLSNAQRLCQCREATIHIKRKVAVQIDGEPWRQNICTLKVKRKPDRAIMLHRSADRNGVETEMANLLDWAEEKKLIDSNVHTILTKEFSRRIEYKTRQRRNKEKDAMFSLKRAIGSTGAISSYATGNYKYSP